MKQKQYFIIVYSLLLFVTGCRKNPADSNRNPYYYNSDWSILTHEKTNPNYEMVFPQNNINKIEISISSSKWNTIGADMNRLFGVNFGAGNGSDPENLSGTENSYVDVNVKFEDKNWKNVGFRLRGNKMLGHIWNQGIYKLPFHLNFDKFEDSIPGINNQRFYGFKELVFNPGYKDPSLIREKIAGDLYRSAGVPAPQTAFYKVYIDFGAGMKYCGVYTAVELPEDNLLLNLLNEKSGNIYKPTSHLNFFNSNEFVKKNNEELNDYTDVQKFVSILNSQSRISNPAQWRQDLMNEIDIDLFIKWLAVSNAIVSMGSYGSSAENFYLYHQSNGKFIWIPWDNNETLIGSPGIIGTAGLNGLSLSMNEVTSNWPLIRYIIDEPDFLQNYKLVLKSFNNEIFNPSSMNGLIDQYYDQISQSVTGISGEQAGYSLLNNEFEFLNEKNNLKNHVIQRNNLIYNYVQ